MAAFIIIPKERIKFNKQNLINANLIEESRKIKQIQKKIKATYIFKSSGIQHELGTEFGARFWWSSQIRYPKSWSPTSAPQHR